MCFKTHVFYSPLLFMKLFFLIPVYPFEATDPEDPTQRDPCFSILEYSNPYKNPNLVLFLSLSFLSLSLGRTLSLSL